MTPAWLAVDFDPDGRHAVVREPIRVALPGRRPFHVPAGFATDFASIPWIFRRWLPQVGGRHARAAVVHDYLCGLGTRPAADNDMIMREVMHQDGVDAFSRWAIYLGLRAGSMLGLRDQWGACR